MLQVFGFDDCKFKVIGEGRDSQYVLHSEDVGAIMTVNIPSMGLTDTMIALKDPEDDIIEILNSYGVIKKLVGWIFKGTKRVPLIEIDREKLLSL